MPAITGALVTREMPENAGKSAKAGIRAAAGHKQNLQHKL
jgi:hypothetical protein